MSAQLAADLSFRSQNLVLNTPTGDIFGTITIPETSKNIPIVLIVPGAGATDRDGNSLSTGINNNCYKLIAEEFARRGIATLRYDKRGVGKSMRNSPGPTLLLENYIDDAKAWIYYLKQTKLYAKVVVLGHGEGSLVGMIAAGKTEADAFISAEGAGMPYDKVLLYGLKNAPKKMQMDAANILDKLKSDIRVDSVSAELSGIFHPSIHPYIKSILSYDPVREFSKLRMPSIILHGNFDLMVPVENANLLAKAKPDAQLRIIRNMNYILKDADDDEAYNQATYYKPYLPLNVECTGALISFVLSLK
jgi:hypothetical protein